MAGFNRAVIIELFCPEKKAPLPFGRAVADDIGPAARGGGGLKGFDFPMALPSQGTGIIAEEDAVNTLGAPSHLSVS